MLIHPVKEGSGRTSMLRAWQKNRGSRFLVYLLTITGIADIALTWISLEQFGPIGELNPVILRMYRIGFVPLWSLITVVSSLVGGIVLVSTSVIYRGATRSCAATSLGLVLGVRIAALSLSISNCFRVPLLGWIGMLMGISTLFFARKHLLDDTTFSVRMVLWKVMDCGDALVEVGSRILQSILPQAQVYPRADLYSTSLDGIMNQKLRRPDWKKALTQMAVIVLALLALVGLLDFLQGHVFRSVPWWLRELGIVEQSQGQAFLVVFVSILLVLAILTYCLLSMAEALAGSQSHG